MVSVPSKFSRCAQPPMMLCSTHVQPRNPKSWSRLPNSGDAAPCSQQEYARHLVSCQRRLPWL